MPITVMSSNLLPILEPVALGAAILYAAMHLVLLSGLWRRSVRPNEDRLRMSVVVAARNESARIPLLLESLARQVRVPDEIVVVDDRSTDGTSGVVEEYRTRLPMLRVVRIEELPSGRAPKKHALERGIAASSGELVCCTDADVVVPPAWLSSIEGRMGPDVGVVVGSYIPLPSVKVATFRGSLLHRFMAYEKYKTTLLSAGSIGWGFAWTASGSNLAYRRSVHEQVGGFSGQDGSISGDDDLFVQRVRRGTGWRIVSMIAPEATVSTAMPETWPEFYRQRLRHFSAGRWYDRRSQGLLGLYHGANFVATLSLCGAIAWPGHQLLLAYVIKVCADLVLCAVGDLHMHRSRAWTWFLPLELLNVAYVATAGPLSRWLPIRWKEPAANA